MPLPPRLALLLSLLLASASQPAPLTARLTLIPDYASGRVSAAGTVTSATTLTADEARLRDWGLTGDLQVWPSDSGASGFNIQGRLTGARLEGPQEDGTFVLRLGLVRLPAGSTLELTLPFTSLALDEVSPPPHNLDELRDPRAPITYLRYTAGSDPLDLNIAIPFVPVRREIDLRLFPLVGQLMQRRPDSYRLYGQVTFTDIRDYAAFEKYCQATVEHPAWPYRTADTLFALDYPPVFHFGYLPPAYQYKPSYLLVRSELESCRYESGAGVVQTSITGRVFHRPADPARFPDFLLAGDVPEGQTEVQSRGAGTGIYEIQLGRVSLAPGDLLKISLPDADLRGITPAPSRYTYDDTGNALAEFDGPASFVLRLRYAPRPQLFLQQSPASMRAFTAGAERLLRGFDDGRWTMDHRPSSIVPGPSSIVQGPSSIVPWSLLLLCLLAAAASVRLPLWPRFTIHFLAAALSYYNFPHVFGILFFALGVHALECWRSGARDAALRALLTLLAAFATLALDTAARSLIYKLDGAQLDLTLFTPALLILFGAVALLIHRGLKNFKWTPSALIGPALALFALAALDGLGKSLPAVLLAGILAALLVRRAASAPSKANPAAGVPDRFRRAARAPFVWIGLAALAVFVLSNDVTGSAAVLAPRLGVLRFLLAPVLLFLSVALSFIAAGGLFLLLYPLLPFNEGYLKAVVFAAGLWLLFVLGIGADDRLITALPSMLAGRFIYYLSGPLLVGIFLEARSETDRKKSAGTSRRASDPSGPAFSLDRLFDPLKTLLSPAGSLISLVAPGLYAWITGQPLVTSYFDVLEALIAFTLI